MTKKHPSYTQNSDIIGSPVDDEMVMMDIDKGSYFGLNSMGSKIWELVEEPKSIPDLVNLLTDEYDISKKECEKQVSEFISALVEANLVTQND